MSWTNERVKILTDDWLAGSSHRQISIKLHVSRNAVVGKVHRLGLTKRCEPVGGPRKAAMAHLTPVIDDGKMKIKTAFSDDPIGDGMALSDLHDDQCHWIPPRHTGSHEKPYTCTSSKAKISSKPPNVYCQHHYDKIFVKPSKRQSSKTILDRRQA